MRGLPYRKRGLGAAFAALAVLAAAPAWAEDAARQGGLPQLRTEYYAGQLFWLFVCFGITYLLMSRIAIPSVQVAQEKRMRIIRADLDAAATANEQAKALQGQYEKALTDARIKAQAAYSEINAAIAAEATAQQAALQVKLSERIAEAERNMATARDAAMRDVADAAKDLAATIVEAVTKTGAAR